MLHMTMFIGNLTGDIFPGTEDVFTRRLRTFFPGNTGRFFRGRFPGSFLPKTVVSTHFGMGTFFPKMDVL
jgi:hypothetical protein